MKFVRKVLLLFSVLIVSPVSIIIAEDAKEDPSQAIGDYLRINKKKFEFLEKTNNFLRENKERFSTVSNEMKELEIELDKTKVRGYNTKIESVFNEASNEYEKMIRIMSEACTKSKDIYNQLMNLPRLDDNTWNFFETSKWVMKEQAKLLQMSVEKTLSHSKTAYGYVEQIRDKISRFSGTLFIFEEDLKSLVKDKQAEIDSKDATLDPAASVCLLLSSSCLVQVAEVAVFKSKLMSMQDALKKYQEDSRNWIEWISRSGSELKNLATDDEKTIAILKGKSEHGEGLVDKVETFLSGGLDERTENWIISKSNKINSLVGEIKDKCYQYIP